MRKRKEKEGARRRRTNVVVEWMEKIYMSKTKFGHFFFFLIKEESPKIQKKKPKARKRRRRKLQTHLKISCVD